MLLAKELQYYLAPIFLFGIFFLIRGKYKYVYLVLILIVFSITWREVGLIRSSRYYSFFIFISTFLGTYAISRIIKTIHKPNNRFLLCVIFVLFALLFHIPKNFLDFKNIYIQDVNEYIADQIKHNNNSLVYIYDKEYKRLGRSFAFTGQVLQLQIDSQWDITDYCNWNGLYYKTSSFILPEKVGEPSISSLRTELNCFRNRCKKVALFFSTSKRNKTISIYRHLPFMPLPLVDEKDLLTGMILKSYIPEFDTYIFQKNNQFIWFIGIDANIKTNTEIIYHVYTDKTELLPPKHQKSGFENISFRINDKDRLKLDNGYFVFFKNIPSSYPVSKIRCGFYSEGKLTLTRFINI